MLHWRSVLRRRRESRHAGLGRQLRRKREQRKAAKREGTKAAFEGGGCRRGPKNSREGGDVESDEGKRGTRAREASCGCSMWEWRRRKLRRRKWLARRKKVVRRRQNLRRTQKRWQRRKLDGRRKLRRRPKGAGHTRHRRRRGSTDRHTSDEVRQHILLWFRFVVSVFALYERSVWQVYTPGPSWWPRSVAEDLEPHKFQLTSRRSCVRNVHLLQSLRCRRRPMLFQAGAATAQDAASCESAGAQHTAGRRRDAGECPSWVRLVWHFAGCEAPSPSRGTPPTGPGPVSLKGVSRVTCGQLVAVVPECSRL